MKPNVPEKIYINSNIENRTWLIGKGDTSFIEYTRTDAFIEKACTYLNEKCRRFILTAKDIDDFKNYVKGE